MLKLSEVDKLHAKYLIGYWRKVYFTRSYRLAENDEDPPIVRELANLLFWADRDHSRDNDAIARYFHMEGLKGLIDSSYHEIERLERLVSEGELGQGAISRAQEQLEIANSARDLLEVMTNGG